MTTITSGALRTTTVRPARFTDTFASEWSKLFSLRSTYITIALGVVLSLGMTALVSLAVGSTFDEWQPADQAEFEPIMFSMAGIIFGGIAFSVLGVLAVSGEYSSGMIRQTLTATPRRWRVLAAKALIVALVTAVFGLVSVVGMFAVGQAVLGSFDMPTTTLGNADALRAVLGLGLTTPFFPLIGLALAFLLRSTAGAITAVLALIWLPEIFGAVLPSWWQENVLSRLPGAALDSAVIGHIADAPTYGDPVVGGIVAAAWLVGGLGLAYLALARRDA